VVVRLTLTHAEALSEQPKSTAIGNSVAPISLNGVHISILPFSPTYGKRHIFIRLLYLAHYIDLIYPIFRTVAPKCV